MTDRSDPSLLTRLKRVGAFLAIVWGVAATFVALDMLSISGADAAIERSGAAASLGLSPAVTGSTACRVPAGQDGLAAPAPPPVRAAAWSLGVQMGVRTRAALSFAEGGQQSTDRQTQQWLASVRGIRDAAEAEASRLADALAVPHVPAFTPRNAVNAIVEFAPFVEGDVNRTASALAEGHGADACELYKLGSYWGYSELVRPAMPGEQNIFALEIGYYASRRALPETVWRPLIQRTPSSAKASEIVAEGDRLTRQVVTYLLEAH